MAFQEIVNFFAEVSAWAHNQEILAIISQSHCKKSNYKGSISFKSNLAPTLLRTTSIPKPKSNADVHGCRMRIVLTDIQKLSRLSSRFFINLFRNCCPITSRNMQKICLVQSWELELEKQHLKSQTGSIIRPDLFLKKCNIPQLG